MYKILEQKETDVYAKDGYVCIHQTDSESGHPILIKITPEQFVRFSEALDYAYNDLGTKKEIRSEEEEERE